MHDRISLDLDVCDDQACIEGKRIPVHLIVKMTSNGDSTDNLLEAYPSIARGERGINLAHAIRRR
jgi:uncharacterized protein (DUF433 family)